MNVFEATCPLIKQVRSSEGAVQTQEFLEVCRQILPVVGMYSIAYYAYTNLPNFLKGILGKLDCSPLHGAPTKQNKKLRLVLPLSASSRGFPRPLLISKPSHFLFRFL
jgi:hypothetical protein